MRPLVIAAWAVLLASVAVLAVFYNSLPDTVEVARSLFGGSEILAPKSPFTVFRIPAIEVVCGLAILVMLNREVKPDVQPIYNNVWLILLFTTAFKSLFQSLEMVSSPHFAGIFFYLTLAVIAAGGVSAIFFGIKAYGKMDRKDWSVTGREMLLLGGLLVLYLGFAIVPMFVFSS